MAEILPIRPRADAAEGAIPEPPAELSERAAQVWRSVVGQWVVGADALPLLIMGCDGLDRYWEATEILRRDGPTVENPTSGAVRQDPAHAVMRDDATLVRQCFRQLRLEPPLSDDQ